MPKLTSHTSAQFTKILLCGDSGTGKTGSICSLAEAGYNVRFLDLDVGLDIVKNLLLSSKAPPIDSVLPIDRVDFITISETFHNVNGKPVARDAKAWSRMLGYLNSWSNTGEKRMQVVDGKPTAAPIPADELFDLGKPEAWGPSAILVLDSLSAASRNAMRYIMKLNSRPAGPTYESDWYEAQNLVEALLAMLLGDDFKTNVIITAHIDYRELSGKNTAYPTTLGKALGPKVGQYFNSVLEVRKSGMGKTTTRNIHTIPASLLAVKNPNPTAVKPTYSIETGLAEYFEAVRKEA